MHHQDIQVVVGGGRVSRMGPVMMTICLGPGVACILNLLWIVEMSWLKSGSIIEIDKKLSLFA
jgi:hypothetical protein